MVADGIYVATVDRIEGDLAVVLVEADGTVVEELTAPIDDLPTGIEAGTVLEVRIEDDTLVDVTIDPDATRERKTSAWDRFDRLSRRPDEPE